MDNPAQAAAEGSRPRRSPRRCKLARARASRQRAHRRAHGMPARSILPQAQDAELQPRAKEPTRRLGGTGVGRRHRRTVAGRRSASNRRPGQSRNGRGGSRILLIAITGALVGPARIVAGCGKADEAGSTSWNTAVSNCQLTTCTLDTHSPRGDRLAGQSRDPVSLPAGLAQRAQQKARVAQTPPASDPAASMTAARHAHPARRTAQHRRCDRAGIPRRCAVRAPDGRMTL